MAETQPIRKFTPVPFSGVLDESSTPAKVAGAGLTDCLNLIYRRYGAWGKRAGSGLVFVATVPANPPPTPQPPSPTQPATPSAPPAAPAPTGSGGSLDPTGPQRPGNRIVE